MRQKGLCKMVVSSSQTVNMPGDKSPKKAKKRKASVSGATDNIDDAPKKTKQQNSFTEIEFCVALRDQNTAFQALEDFITTATDYPEKINYDIVGSYCRGSAECVEIFKMLETGDKHKPPQIILVNIADRLPKLKSTGKAIVHRLLASHVGPMIFCMNISNKSGHIKSALKLLSAMVMQGDNAPRDILSQVDLQHSVWPPLLNRRDILDPMDVRACMIHFMLSFLIIGERDTVRSVLESKGFLTMIFPGLVEDKFVTLQMVLPTLKEKVVENPSVTKTLKVRLFSERSLKDLIKLYRWKGPRKYATKKSKGEKSLATDEDNEGMSEQLNENQGAVADLVHQLLLQVCCDFKLGINFFDKSYGTSGKNQNHVLTGFLSSLTSPQLSARWSELVVEVLKACPDQLLWYLPALKHTLSPRVSNKWITAMDLLHKVYLAQPEVAPCMRLNDRVPITKLVTMARCNILPPREIWSHMVQAVRHKSPVVQHEGLHILQLVFRRVKSTIDFCSNKHPLYSPAELEQFVSALKDSIFKLCPDISTLMYCWTRAVQTPGSDLVLPKSEDSKQAEGEEEEDMDVDDVLAKGFPEVCRADHLLRVLQALCEYQLVLPDVFAEHAVNFGLLLEGVKMMSTDDSTSTHQMSLLQIHLLRLLAESKAKQVTWLKETSSGHSTLYLLLDMISMTGHNPKLLPVAINLLQRLLVSTGIFTYTESEVTLWLEQLVEAVKEGSESELLTFVEKVFTAVLKDPYTYTEKVSDVVSESAGLDSGAEAASTATASDHIIDTILSMDEVEITADSKASQIQPSSSLPSRYPFSALIPAALKFWTEEYKTKDEIEHKGVKKYLKGVVHVILHTQTDPVPLCLLLQHHKSMTLDSLSKRWLPSHKGPVTPKKQKSLSFEEGVLSDVLTAAFTAPVSHLLSPDTQEKLEEKCREMEIDQSRQIVTQLLLYMRTCIHESENNEQMLEATDFYLKLISIILETVLKHKDNKPEDSVTPDVRQSNDINLGSLYTRKSIADVLLDLYSVLARHPDLQEWFLWQHPPKPLSKKDKTGMDLASIITRRMAAIFQKIPAEMSSGIPELKQYREETRRLFTSYIDGLLQGNNDLDGSDVLEAMAAMLKATSWSEIIEDAKKLTQLKPKMMVHKMKATAQGTLLITIIQHILSKMKEDTCLSRQVLCNLSLDSVSRMFQLALEHSLPDLDTVLYDLLQVCPLYAMAANQRHFLICLEAPSGGVRLKLAEIMVAHSSASCQWFDTWWKKQSADKKTEMKWNILPITYQYALSLCPGVKAPSKELNQLQSLYWADLVAWLQTNIEPQEEETRSKIAMLSFLTSTSAELENVQDSWSEFLVFLTGCSHLKPLQAAYIHELSDAVDRLDTEDTLPVWDVYVSTCATCISNLLNIKGAKANRPAVKKLLENVLKVLNGGKGEEKSLAEVIQPVWDQLVKTGLRGLYTDVNMLQLLKKLVGVVYSCQSGVIPAHTVYEMLMSHSQFLNTILDVDNSPAKDALIDLMLTLARTEPSKCCSKSHLTVLLGAYSATLHRTDQKILLLMALYEASGCSLEEQRPFLWGPKAIEHYSVKKSLGASLWKGASTEQVLESLDEEKLAKSCLHFPLQRKLMTESVVEAENVSSLPDVYDPRFLLPLFSQLLQQGMMVQCFRFVQSGSLSYIFTALSSHDSTMRGAAYHVLSEFYTHVDGQGFPGKDQVLYLLNTVKNSITSANLKLAPLITAFLARAARLMVTPDGPLYSAVNEFLLLKPSMDVLNVPEFYKLFNSSTLEHKIHRSWILSLLADGLREAADHRLFEKRYVFKIICSFHDSHLSDERTQLQVLQVLHQAVRHRTITIELIKHDALLAWINTVIKSSGPSLEKQQVVVDILSSLWRTVSVGRVDEHGQTKAASVPLAFTTEMIHLLLHLLHLLRGSGDLQVTSKFITLLKAVLGHQKTIMSKMPRPHPPLIHLKTSDSLELLRLWCSVIHDHSTIGQLDILSTHLDQGNKEQFLNKKSKIDKKNNAINEGLSVEDRKKLELSCLHDVLEVLTYWRPLQNSIETGADKMSLSITEVATLLFLINWSLNKSFVTFPRDLELFSRILLWVKDWVLKPKSPVLRSILISDKSSSGEVIGNILSIYGHGTSVLLERAHCNLPTSVERVRVCGEMKSCVTQILAGLVDHALHCGNGEGNELDKRLTQHEYCQSMKIMAKINHSYSTVSLLLQELWLSASSPCHFKFLAEKD